MGCDCCCSLSAIVYGVGLFVIASKLLPFIHKMFFKKDKPELQEKDWKKDVVYLYQFNGNSTCSSISPFCVKIEAFLRIHNIKFVRRNTMSGRGSNGKLPAVELNGEQIADSQVIIKRLAEKFHIKEYETPEKAAIARAVERMADNHTFYALMHWKGQDMGKVLASVARGFMPAILIDFVAPVMGYFMGGQIKGRIGATIGKFSEEEYKELLRSDFTALQIILGSKKFLIGEKPTAADATVFSQLSTVYYLAPGCSMYPCQLLDTDEYAPLKQWLERVRDTAFGSEFHA